MTWRHDKVALNLEPCSVSRGARWLVKAEIKIVVMTQHSIGLLATKMKLCVFE